MTAFGKIGSFSFEYLTEIFGYDNWYNLQSSEKKNHLLHHNNNLLQI